MMKVPHFPCIWCLWASKIYNQLLRTRTAKLYLVCDYLGEKNIQIICGMIASGTDKFQESQITPQKYFPKLGHTEWEDLSVSPGRL